MEGIRIAGSAEEPAPVATTGGRFADLLLAGGGQVGTLMRALDWSATPLGSPEAWPQSLRTIVSTCLNSRFPILVWWGPDLVMLYNDAYVALIGAKHPHALGRSGREVFPEIWDIIGPMLRAVLTRGEATWSEHQLLLLERHGYSEECYFTFSYSPIRAESGAIGGVFTALGSHTTLFNGAAPSSISFADPANNGFGSVQVMPGADVTATDHRAITRGMIAVGLKTIKPAPADERAKAARRVVIAATDGRVDIARGIPGPTADQSCIVGRVITPAANS